MKLLRCDIIFLFCACRNPACKFPKDTLLACWNLIDINGKLRGISDHKLSFN